MMYQDGAHKVLQYLERELAQYLIFNAISQLCQWPAL